MSSDDGESVGNGEPASKSVTRTKNSKARNLLPDVIPIFDNVEARVNYIADLMYDLSWITGKTSKVLAKAWNLADSTVGGYAAEASRMITADSKSVKRDITVGARKLFVDAVNSGDAKSAAAIGKILADVSGANAPTETRIDVDASPERAKRLAAAIFGDVGAGASDASRDDSKADSVGSNAMTDES